MEASQMSDEEIMRGLPDSDLPLFLNNFLLKVVPLGPCHWGQGRIHS